MYGNSFYNPYLGYNYANNFMNTSRLGKRPFPSLFKNFNLSKFLTGTGKTLNVINQAIPIYYQIKPVISNAKTMFKVMSAVKNNDETNNTIKQTNTSPKTNYVGNGSPTFFI